MFVEIIPITVIREWGCELQIYLPTKSIDYFYENPCGNAVIITTSGREFCTTMPFGEFYNRLLTGRT